MLTDTAQKRGNTRNSSFELLRSISILLILLHHFAVHGGFEFNSTDLSVPRLWWLLIESGGKLGVNCFVLITGYFLSANARAVLNSRRIFRLLGQMIFYSVSIYLALCALGMQPFDIPSLVKACFPVTANVWWFAGTYLLLYLVHPFLNRLIHAVSRRTCRNMIVGFIALASVIPSITLKQYQMNQFLWFVTLYFAAGYIRLYDLNPRHTAHRYALCFAAFALLRYASSVIIILMSAKIPALSKYALAYHGEDSILTLAASVSLFMTFAKLRIKPRRAINTIASASFGVYLIHDNPLIREPLWVGILNVSAYQDSAMIMPYSIFAAIAAFACCTIIDLLRQYVLERPYMRIVDRYSQAWLKPFRAAIRFAQNIVFGSMPDDQ